MTVLGPATTRSRDATVEEDHAAYDEYKQDLEADSSTDDENGETSYNDKIANCKNVSRDSHGQYTGTLQSYQIHIRYSDG